MKCPNCGASGQSGVCVYCDTPLGGGAAQTVIINNYYYDDKEEGASRSPYEKAAEGAQAHGAGAAPVASPSTSPKSRLVLLLLCLFFGFWGVHRFYAGRWIIGLLFVFTLGGLGIAWIIDILLAAFGKIRDSNGLPISDWRV